MTQGMEGNAMTEVALALAMAFFSIMVLAMVSMAAPGRDQAVAPATASHTPRRVIEVESAGKPSPPATDQRIVIFHDGAYLNPDLTPFDPAGIKTERLVLAIDPSTEISRAMAARNGLGDGTATMTVLDEPWLQRLKGAVK